MAGDFNALLHEDNKKGGSKSGSHSCKLFSKFCNDLCLKDVGFQGSKFTWNRGAVFERLDRVLCNHSWESLVPDTRVFHLHKIKSDHRPLAINFGMISTPKVPRPFRFLSGWLNHDDFSTLVVANWSREACLEGSVCRFVDAVKK